MAPPLYVPVPRPIDTAVIRPEPISTEKLEPEILEAIPPALPDIEETEPLESVALEAKTLVPGEPTAREEGDP